MSSEIRRLKEGSTEIKWRRSNPRFIDEVRDERWVRCLLRFTTRLTILFWLNIDPQIPIVAQFHRPYHKQPETTAAKKTKRRKKNQQR